MEEKTWSKILFFHTFVRDVAVPLFIHPELTLTVQELQQLTSPCSSAL